MAKHHLFLHVGPDVVEIDDTGLERLAAVGVRVPDVGPGHIDRADLEIRRAHKSAGLRRKDVEGSWAKVCRRIFRLRSDAFVSVPGFFGADDEQAKLALDGLHGLKVHLVVVHSEPPPSWSRLITSGRIHVVAGGLAPAAELAEAIAQIVLSTEKARLDKALVKLKKRRKAVKEQLVA